MIRVLATGEKRKIVRQTPSEGVEGEIVWTPDSKRLIYNWWKTQPGGDDRYDLRMVNADGSGMKILADFSSPSTSPHFIEPLDCSPDGAAVAVHIRPTNSEVQSTVSLIPLRGGTVRVLKTLPAGTPASVGYFTGAKFARDGRYLAYGLRNRAPRATFFGCHWTVVRKRRLSRTLLTTICSDGRRMAVACCSAVIAQELSISGSRTLLTVARKVCRNVSGGQSDESKRKLSPQRARSFTGSVFPRPVPTATFSSRQSTQSLAVWYHLPLQ